MVVALGITMTGDTRFRGVVETDTENEKGLTPFLRSLVERGLDVSPGLLVIVDGGASIAASALRIWCTSNSSTPQQKWGRRARGRPMLSELICDRAMYSGPFPILRTVLATGVVLEGVYGHAENPSVPLDGLPQIGAREAYVVQRAHADGEWCVLPARGGLARRQPCSPQAHSRDRCEKTSARRVTRLVGKGVGQHLDRYVPGRGSCRGPDTPAPVGISDLAGHIV